MLTLERATKRGRPPKRAHAVKRVLRKHDCRLDGHEDPNAQGQCPHCLVILNSTSKDAWEWNRQRWAEYTGLDPAAKVNY